MLNVRKYAKKWDQANQDTRNAIKARKRAAQEKRINTVGQC
jgi:hypothetical protein